MNAVKKNFKAVNFFSLFKRLKNIFHRYQQNAVKKNFFTAKIHKNSLLSPHSTLKDEGALFFPSLLTANPTLFFDQTSTRVIIFARKLLDVLVVGND